MAIFDGLNACVALFGLYAYFPLWQMLDFMNDKFRSSDSEEGVDIGLPTLLIALAAALSGSVCMGEGAVCLC